MPRRYVYQKIIGGGIPIKFEFLHGVSFAFYFEDPEGNVIEVFWPTGLEYPQQFGQKIDLTKTEEELVKEFKVLTGRKDFTLPQFDFVEHSKAEIPAATYQIRLNRLERSSSPRSQHQVA